MSKEKLVFFSDEERETRNSPLRKLTAEPIRAIVERLHQRFPGLSPDQLTLIGLGGVTLGSWLAELRNRKPDKKFLSALPPLVVLSLSSLMDTLDGALARVAPEKAKPWGQVLDASLDRLGEAAMALSRMVQAQERGDRVGEILAAGSAVSCSWSSIARAIVEVSGSTVSESGRGIGVFGTSFLRRVNAIVAIVFPEVRGVPVQWLSDALTVTATAVAAVDRLRQMRKPGDKFPAVLPAKERKQALVRATVLTGTMFLIAGATVLTFTSLQRRKKA